MGFFERFSKWSTLQNYLIQVQRPHWLFMIWRMGGGGVQLSRTPFFLQEHFFPYHKTKCLFACLLAGFHAHLGYFKESNECIFIPTIKKCYFLHPMFAVSFIKKKNSWGGFVWCLTVKRQIGLFSFPDKSVLVHWMSLAVHKIKENELALILIIHQIDFYNRLSVTLLPC